MNETQIITMHGSFPHLMLRFTSSATPDDVAMFREDLLDAIFEDNLNLIEDRKLEVFELHNGDWTPVLQEDLPWNQNREHKVDSPTDAPPVGNTVPVSTSTPKAPTVRPKVPGKG